MRLSEFKIRSGIGHGGEYFLDLFPRGAFLLELDDGDPEVHILRAEGGLGGAFVGRGKNCHVLVLRKQVSTLHAQVVAPRRPDDPWRLVDLNSTNGTFVNDSRLEPALPVALEDEATIRFGDRARFRFLEPRSLLRRLQRLEGVGAQRNPLYLCSELFNPIQLEFDRPLVFGRSPGASIVLPHKEVSRRHAEIERCPEGVFVRDLGSSNGTFVGDERLERDDPRPLAPGDRVDVGPFHFVVRGPEELAAEGYSARDLMSTTQTISGDLQELPLVDILQTILDRQRTGVLEVQGDDREGCVLFRDGVVCDAYTEAGLNGTLAVRSLLEARRGAFTLRSEEGTAIGQRKITTGLQTLLLEQLFRGGAEEVLSA